VVIVTAPQKGGPLKGFLLSSLLSLFSRVTFTSGIIANGLNRGSIGAEAYCKCRKGGTMKTDDELQKNVLDELRWEPSVNAAEIGVSVKEGVVTLTGFVDSFAEKLAAERAAKRVYGVKALANDIEVRPPIREPGEGLPCKSFNPKRKTTCQVI
jgi:hypothetical protein